MLNWEKYTQYTRNNLFDSPEYRFFMMFINFVTPTLLFILDDLLPRFYRPLIMNDL
uniref:Uncharacterized protein n=1 Tax=Rhizophagus irregularis (strain DAOM 181602 / DAOM 197198 / MUCL 43194) TaxID=747089 RepID=U9TMI1_RHIID